MKEQTIQRQIICFLTQNGYLVTRINSIRQSYVKSYTIANFGSVGFPDLIAMKDNQFFLFEVKTEIGRLTQNQQKFQEFASTKNVKVHVVRCVEDVQKILQN